MFTPLSREEVIKAITFNYPERIPLYRAKWWGEGFVELHKDKLKRFDRYPEDVVECFIDPINYSSMGLSWQIEKKGGHDSVCIIDEWSKLDEFIEKIPDPYKHTEMIEQHLKTVTKARDENRYVLFGWWRLFFERPWEIRGMENLLTDYYEYPDKVKKLHEALLNLYERWLSLGVEILKPDGFWTSDDLGHQTNSMMSPEIFKELIKPFYVKLGKKLKEYNLHWWLHSCGNNTPLMENLIDAGVNVFHPVQKGTMDIKETIERFGGRISFLAGIDVQHVLREGTVDEVKKEVRFIIDNMDIKEGGLCIAAGNGILPGTPLENIESFLNESLSYGIEHRKKFL